MRRVVASEAAAHVRVLERRGEVSTVPGTSPDRFRLAAA